MDPQAEMLRSQLQPFFPGPSGGPSAYDEFDANEAEQDGEESEEVEAREQDEEMPERCQAGPSSVGQEGFDSLGRRGGVWVRKPRSSRKGSGGEPSFHRSIASSEHDRGVLGMPQLRSPLSTATANVSAVGTAGARQADQRDSDA